jgi:cytochrome c heme-lyase
MSCPAHNSPTSTNAEVVEVQGLDNSRETSSIPNQKNQKWIYPSERQFYTSLVRKKKEVDPKDLKTIIPVHNLINEQCWSEITKWEKLNGSGCVPKLVRFEGNANTLTPKAFFNSFLGYKKPFDRHDWVIDRCGDEVTYVIDFYRGRKI